MTAQPQETPIITASLVAEAYRLDYLPTYFGKYYIAGENLLYRQADLFVEGYCGGYWDFYTLSNGGFFAALNTDKQLRVVITENYFSELMSAEAAGITLTLYVLGRLSSARIPESESDRFVDLYHKLRDFALSHAESHLIMTAID